jgi:hypothetical protein
VTLQDLGSLGEVVGAAATVATLVYLAFQLRLNSASIRATAELEASRQLAAFVARVSADSNMKRIYDLVANGAQLSPEDERDYSWLLAEFFHMSEGIYIQHCKGHLSGDIWDEYQLILVGFLHSDGAALVERSCSPLLRVVPIPYRGMPTNERGLATRRCRALRTIEHGRRVTRRCSGRGDAVPICARYGSMAAAENRAIGRYGDAVFSITEVCDVR